MQQVRPSTSFTIRESVQRGGHKAIAGAIGANTMATNLNAKWQRGILVKDDLSKKINLQTVGGEYSAHRVGKNRGDENTTDCVFTPDSNINHFNYSQRLCQDRGWFWQRIESIYDGRFERQVSSTLSMASTAPRVSIPGWQIVSSSWGSKSNPRFTIPSKMMKRHLGFALALIKVQTN